MRLGEFNILKILRGTSVGFYLADESGQDVLLPHKYIPENAQVGEEVEVFVYRDSEDRLIATNLKPYLQLHKFGILEVVGVNITGVFLDWGLEKDLFVPFREQNRKFKTGEYVPVYLYIDEQTDRLVASAQLHKFFKNHEVIDLKTNQKVDLLVYERTDLGYNVIINHRYKGLVYHNEIYQNIAWGDQIQGYVKTLREDGKIDVVLQPIGVENSLDGHAQKILEKLKAGNGILHLSDSSDPTEIQEILQMSKKSFKRTIGHLYKQHLIRICISHIELI